MTESQTLSAYFTYCKLQKNLDNKTLKAYQIDLKQFVAFYPKPTTVKRTDMELYIEHLMEHYKASTVKRKIAALKAYYHYLVYEEILDHSPFEKIQLHIRQEILLPRTIDRPILGAIFSAAYRELSTAHSKVSELCTITCDNLNLDSQVVLIRGKGSKERKIYLASAPVVRALKEYLQVRVPRIADEPFFFLNRDGNRLSEQSVRRIINRYTDLSNQPGHYTPHMFRHSFATYLWDACGDVYEVKEILGHSSIKTTERYVHASFERQKKVLSSMHPRATLEFTY